MGHLKMAMVIAMVNLMMGCGIWFSSETPKYPDANIPLPESDEISGWQKTSEIRTFDATNLWEYINGGAEKYTKVGLKKMMTAHYLYKEKMDSPALTEAVVDIYKMNTPEGARQIFDSELSIGSLRIKLGSDAQLTQNSLTFWKGSYFVRLIAFRNTPEVKKVLVGLGKGIEKRLK